jgi:hypothetical protein
LQTTRKGAWWAFPLLCLVVFGGFIVYATWAAFQGSFYFYNGHGADYLSPFYSPELFGSSPHAWFGPKPGWWPAWAPFSPALLILWAPGGFRMTCYYYRGAYYKAFWADPPACAVGEPRKKYLGEAKFPLIIQNVHRYFMYIAVVFLVLLAIDVYHARWWVGADGKEHFGIGLGTIILAVNVCLLSGYAFGCHSLRHLVGGFKDTISGSPACAKAYSCVSCLNKRHMVWAWCSLFGVALTDLYVRLLSMGVISDWRIL